MNVRSLPLSPKMLLGAIAFAISGLSACVQAGVTYGFTTISTNMSLTFPAINDNGVAAFEGRFASASGVYSGSGGPLTTIGAGTSTAAYNVWINNSNQVAFVNNPSLGVFSVSRGTGGPITTIHTYSPGGPHELTYTLPVISDNGTVTYLSPNTGFFSGNGGAVSTVSSISGTTGSQYSGPFDGLAVSHNGTLAYEKYPISSQWWGQSIIINRGGVETVAITLPSSLSAGGAVNSIAVNNSGMVAMTGAFSFQDGGLYLADGNTLTRVVGPDTAVQAAGNASINDLGNFAFLGTYSSNNTSFNGIFTSGSVQDRVIQTGDSLGGSTVTNLAFGTDALNDNGQVVFWAQLANGTSGVFVATPVPEPASLVLMGIAGIPLLLRRRPDNKSPAINIG